MIDRVRRWWARRGGDSAGHLSLWLLAGVAVLSLIGAVITDFVSAIAGDALIGLPPWLRLLVLLVLGGIAAAVYSALNPAVPPGPDVPPDQPAVPVAPAAPAGFVGREPELADVVELVTLNQATAVVGRRAVGTSAFALRVAQEVRDLFPDGQVYLDLRGATAGGPLSPARALWRVIHRLGLPEPRSNRRDRLDTAADALHGWLSGRRVLFIFDNVDDPEQVRRLLTHAPECRVLLAGSVDLERLDAVHTYHLKDLRPDESVRLLAAAANDPAVAVDDTDAAALLVTMCSSQPLAIRLVGELIRDRGWPVERAAAAIRQGPEDVSGRIVSGDAMALRPLWEACDMLYRDLPAAQRRLFRLLAVPPTTEIGTGTAAAVAGITPRAAAELLDGLARRGLIESGRPGRYRIRQMLVTSARRFLEQDSTWRVNRATVRLVRYYATIAEEYADQLLPTGEGQERDRELAVAEARAWFRQEREVMFRMVTAGSFATSRARSLLRPGGVTPWLQRLAIALCTWYAYDGQLGEWQDVCEAVLAGRIGPNNRTMEFWARNELGTVYRLNGDPATGAALLNEAAELCAGRYHRGLGQARTNHGLALLDLGDVEAAIRHLDAGLALRPHSDRHGRAVSALGLGVAYLRAGELTAARQCLIEATNHFDEVADTRGTAAALNNLGAVLWEQQDHTGAREHWAAARERFARLGDQAGQSAALLNVAAALLSAGHGSPAEARDLLLESLTLTTARPATRSTGLVHLHLGDAYRRCGDPASARTHWEQALRVLASVGDPAVVDARQRLRREART